ncbi:MULTISPECIES: ABC transporter substrate-binding protein [Psychrobacillus]|uniref:ABC transporter substrate-binding protein n=1 Tax=Psychrobacillus faecigallinarum TaxID=2762235 RepID=A0ABR8RAL0_9BACI|nr:MULTISPECIES: ABC transporter substrate-binding protein [Psychrobacillus]MBD7944837.1 ABC transporter substrate-binding protein [Psychrobacillus faecigallinarum]QEY21287.1 ABC transporter substrate-binding protein [Psychrobacillus sp. AK 1817]QGM31802.1 extracellular solute-binding protein [Bacillus sp. N3536]
MGKKFKFTWLFMILLGILALAACTNSDEGSSTEPVQKSDEDVEKSEEGKTVISFWHAMSGSGQTALDSLVADFNASQDDYEVKAEFQGSYEESLTKLRSVGGTADAPAITQVFEVGTKYMIESGFIEPMQKFIDEDNYDLSQLEENILNYYSLDGELYSMPFNSSTPVMLYNKDAFKEAGLDPENPPKTFQEVIDAAAKLKTDEMKGFSMLTYGWFFEQLVATQGGLYVNEENGRAGDATEAVFNGEEGQRVFEFLNTMNKAGTFGNFGTNWDDIRAAFQSGKVAMYMDSSAGVRGIIDNAPFEVGAAYIPYADEVDRKGVVIGGASLWMSKGIAEIEQKAAWEFMKYLTTPEVQAKWHLDTGYFAINPSAYEEDIVKKAWEEMPQLKVTVEQLQSTEPSIATQGALISVFPESRQQIVTALENLYQGMDPKEALDAAAEGTNRAIDIANKTK